MRYGCDEWDPGFTDYSNVYDKIAVYDAYEKKYWFGYNTEDWKNIDLSFVST